MSQIIVFLKSKCLKELPVINVVKTEVLYNCMIIIRTCVFQNTNYFLQDKAAYYLISGVATQKRFVPSLRYDRLVFMFKNGFARDQGSLFIDIV